MMRMGPRARELGSVLGSIAALVAIAGCGETARSEACAPGDFEPAPLGDGGSGFLRCSGDGSAYLAYDGPDPNAPPDAGTADAGTGEVGAPSACSTSPGAIGFMCPGCATDSDCAPGLVCFPFVNKTGGNLCTRSCKDPTSCPSPSTGCGNNGHCKP